jgi:hypothetical protein
MLFIASKYESIRKQTILKRMPFAGKHNFYCNQYSNNLVTATNDALINANIATGLPVCVTYSVVCVICINVLFNPVEH